ncbi:MAG TPA: hypothetical protein VFQ40_07375 [Actinomycetota bacterium]|nr:hypothetical protein [Actinomycetota bacterium]
MVDPIARLETGRSLVLLDNAEHLLPALAEELAPIIDAAQGGTFLVTSRTPLHLGSVFEYPVPPMNPEDATSFLAQGARGRHRVGSVRGSVAPYERLQDAGGVGHGPDNVRSCTARPR